MAKSKKTTKPAPVVEPEIVEEELDETEEEEDLDLDDLDLDDIELEEDEESEDSDDEEEEEEEVPAPTRGKNSKAEREAKENAAKAAKAEKEKNKREVTQEAIDRLNEARKKVQGEVPAGMITPADISKESGKEPREVRMALRKLFKNHEKGKVWYFKPGSKEHKAILAELAKPKQPSPFVKKAPAPEVEEVVAAPVIAPAATKKTKKK